MNTIILKNFKSYQNQSLSSLNPHINIVIGSNGQGKSNFFKAIPFCLTDKVKINKNQFNNYAHRARANQNEQIQVSIIFKAKHGEETSYHKFERIWSPQMIQHYRANERSVTKGQFQNFIESLGLSYSNPYNIIQQGKITQITLMDEYELYKLLEETTGFRRYQRKHEQVLQMLKKSSANKIQIQLLMTDLQEKFKIIQSKRGEFEYFFIEEKAKKARCKRSYEGNLLAIKDKVAALKAHEVQNTDKIKKIKLKMKEQSDELQNVEIMGKLNQQKFSYYISEDSEDGIFVSNTQLTQKIKDYASNLKANQKSRDQKSNQFKKKNQKLEQLKNKIKPYKEKYEILKNDYETQKKFEGGEKDAFKRSLTTEIQTEKENISSIQKQIKKINKIKGDMKIPNEQKEKDELNKLNLEINQINNEIKNNKIEIIDKNRKKNHIQSELQVTKSQRLFYQNKLRKCMPLLDFNLLNILRKQNVKGVYGYLIQFVNIEPDVAFAYEIAGLAKLCSLLVQDESVCAKVIACNKQNKGKQINILPMTFVKKHPIEKKNYPQSQDCFNLLNDNWISLRNHNFGDDFNQNLKKLISNTFNKHVLVKDYDLGLQVSKQYHLTCITSDKQIIYSEGYLCKVGHQEILQEKLEVYRKYDQKQIQYKRLTQQLNGIQNNLVDLQNQEIQIIRKQRNAEQKHRQIETKLSDIAVQKRSLQRIISEQKKLEQARQKCLEGIKHKENQLSNLEKKKAIKVNLQQLKQTERIYTQLMNTFNNLSQQVFEIEEALLILKKEEEKLKGQLQQIEQQKQIGSKKAVLIPSKEMIENLKLQEAKIRERKQNLSAQMLEIENELKQMEEVNADINNRICLMEQEQKHCMIRIQEIGPVQSNVEDLQQLSNSFSMNRSIDQRNRRKARHFSAKDKILFSKFFTYAQSFKAQKQLYNEVQEAELKFNQLLRHYQSQNDEIMKEVITKFEKQFDEIFKKIVESGKTEVRCKKIADKTKNGIKYRSCLLIKVSFDESTQNPKKWNDFSGGQKTVISICLLMALQKCQPAPFYIFDEIDSALDKQYVQKIAKLILYQSQYSQYFITSFKSEMLHFPEEFCNYYLVKNEERVSKIKKISMEQAQHEIEAIAN